MRLTLVISTAPRAWATIRAAVWSMPIAGHGTFPSMGLRRLGFSDSRRGQSVADHPGNRVPHRRSDQSDGGAWRAVTLARAGYLLLAGRDTLFSRRSGFRVRRGCSSMVEQKPSKLMTRVRFPSPAPRDAWPQRTNTNATTTGVPLATSGARHYPSHRGSPRGAPPAGTSPCSSVVEHSLGKGEVARSIRAMGTKNFVVD